MIKMWGISIIIIPNLFVGSPVTRRQAIHDSLLRILHTLLDNPFVFTLCLPELSTHFLNFFLFIFQLVMQFSLAFHHLIDYQLFLSILLYYFLVLRQLSLCLLQFL